jgi:hypothetical protein
VIVEGGAERLEEKVESVEKKWRWGRGEMVKRGWGGD